MNQNGSGFSDIARGLFAMTLVGTAVAALLLCRRVLTHVITRTGSPDPKLSITGDEELIVTKTHVKSSVGWSVIRSLMFAVVMFVKLTSKKS
jgi:hypothetical protein